MNRTTLLPIGGVLAASFLGLPMLQSQSPNRNANLPNPISLIRALPNDPASKAVGEYLLGTKVNETPAKMKPPVAAKCAPSSQQAAPHIQYYLTVYVNDLGKPVVAESKPKFPVGTVLVKEKLSTPTTPKPELLTAMVKLEPGYDPEHGDWEYFVLAGDARKITARGKLETCRSCHDARKDTDYAFLSYLSAKDRERLQPRR